jgi:hypothetical protein
METQTPPWRIAGSYYEVCNCEVICPCRRQNGAMGGKPTYENCDFALSWWIKDGSLGAVDLADMKVVMAGRWETTPGDPWRVNLYIDDRATDDQRAALADLFLGKAGGYIQASFAAGIVEVFGIKSATIELDHTRAREKIEVAPFLTVRTREAVQHEFPVSCGIPGHEHPGQEIVADVFRYQDGPYDWTLHGKCGFSTDFAYTS